MGSFFSRCSNQQPVSNDYILHTTRQQIHIQQNQRSASKDGTIEQALNDLKHAGASEKTLDTVRQCIETKARELDLQDDSLRSLPTSVLRHLAHLKSLIVKACPIENLPEDFGDYFPNLQQLFLCELLVSEIPQSLANMRNLMRLDIYRCKNLVALPENIGDFKKLNVLWIKNCPSIFFLPENFGALIGLRDLRFDSVELEGLPNSITNLSALKKLEITRAPKLTSLPDDIGKLAALNVLTISRCGLERFPKSLTQLSNLEFLICFENRLESFPDDIDKLNKLDTISVSNNLLLSLPYSIARLPHLESLCIFNNLFTELPSCVTSLRKKCNVNLGDLSVEFSREILQTTYELLLANKGPQNLRKECVEALRETDGTEEMGMEDWDAGPSVI